MKSQDRRKAILERLRGLDKPVRGSELASEFDISRQIIVSDISALKNEGNRIISTHNGYILEKEAKVERIFKVKHTKDQTDEELRTIVVLGGTVVNVYVWHRVYGRIEAPLGISTLDDVDRFMDGVRSGKSTELMNITGGYHYHAVSADSENTLEMIQKSLESMGFIVPEI